MAAYPKFMNFRDSVAMGLTDFTYIHKFGYTPNASTTSSPIWDNGGPYTYISTAKYVKVVSDDTDDTTADTGAREVTIYGVGSGYTSQSETLTMTGFVGKTSTMQYLRVNRVVVDAVGSSGYNEGKIAIYPDQAGSTATAGTGVLTTTSIVMAVVLTTTCQSQMCLYTVPLSYTAYLTNIHASCSEDNEIEIKWMQREYGKPFQQKGLFHTYRTVQHVPFSIPVPIPARTDIEMRALGSTSAANVAAMFEMILVKAE